MHEHKIRVVDLKEGTGDVASGNMTTFMCKDGGMDEYRFGRDRRSHGFVFGNMFSLLAVISTGACLYFTSTFFGEKHKGGEGFALTVMGKSVGIFGRKTAEDMELTKLFHHGLSAMFSKLMETCLGAILFLIVGVPDKDRLSTMEHDVVTCLSKGLFIFLTKTKNGSIKFTMFPS